MGYDRFLEFMPSDTWKYLPHTFAAHMSDGAWLSYDYLVMLSNIIVTAVTQGGGRILVSLPPRHGKSSFLSQWLPFWFLSMWPQKRVILTTYEANFAATWGRKVRNLVQEKGPEVGVHLAPDATASNNWATFMEGGMMTAGVGGPITGKGGDLLLCFPAETLIKTEIGDIRVDELYRMDDPPQVLSYDFESKAVVSRKITWKRKSEDYDFVEIRTLDGHVVRATKDHRIYCTKLKNLSTKFIKARLIEPRDLVYIYKLKDNADSTITPSVVSEVHLIYKRSEPVYDIRVEGTHNFFADGLLVHNCDDPHKNWQEAQSPTIRKTIKDWFDSTFYTRLEPGGTIIVLHCMTGDTPVAMADGSWKRLDEIMSGDMVRSYKDGCHVSSRVVKVKNQGPDNIIRIKTGHSTVKCNARHPFLVQSSDGTRSWVRAGELSEGDLLVVSRRDCFKKRMLITENDEFITDRICKITHLPDMDNVYDIQVENTECFIADGIVSHNTRWHEDDLIGYLMREKPEDGWFHLRIPAIAEDWNNEEDPLGRKVGAALCPQRYDEKALNRIKANMTPMMWNALFQQRPAPMEGSIFLRKNWKYYSVLPKCGFVIQSWDTASKKNWDSAYSVCQTWGVSDLGAVLIDQWRDKVEYPQLLRQAEIQYLKYRPNAVLIEDRDSGQALIQSLQQNTTMPILPIYPDMDKVVRAQAVSPWHEAGRVWVPDPVKTENLWVADLIENAATFPNAVFKDEIDSMSQALAYIMTMAMGGRILSCEKRRTSKLLEGYRKMM